MLYTHICIYSGIRFGPSLPLPVDPGPAFVSLKCPKKRRNPICQARALAMPRGHAFIKNWLEKKAKGKDHAWHTKNWRRLRDQTMDRGPRRPDRVQQRVENKNFYLNGKNQQMQRKTI